MEDFLRHEVRLGESRIENVRYIISTNYIPYLTRSSRRRTAAEVKLDEWKKVRACVSPSGTSTSLP